MVKCYLRVFKFKFKHYLRCSKHMIKVCIPYFSSASEFEFWFWKKKSLFDTYTIMFRGNWPAQTVQLHFSVGQIGIILLIICEERDRVSEWVSESTGHIFTLNQINWINSEFWYFLVISTSGFEENKRNLGNILLKKSGLLIRNQYCKMTCFSLSFSLFVYVNAFSISHLILRET